MQLKKPHDANKNQAVSARSRLCKNASPVIQPAFVSLHIIGLVRQVLGISGSHLLQIILDEGECVPIFVQKNWNRLAALQATTAPIPSLPLSTPSISPFISAMPATTPPFFGINTRYSPPSPPSLFSTTANKHSCKTIIPSTLDQQQECISPISYRRASAWPPHLRKSSFPQLPPRATKHN